MKNLILISNYFPYGNGEPYLETESNYYTNYFDRVFCYSIMLRPVDLKIKRTVDSKIVSWPSPLPSTLKNTLKSYAAFLDANFYTELKKITRQKRISISSLRQLISFLSRAHHEAKRLSNLLSKEGLTPDSEGIIYTYRFEHQPYIALLLKKKFPKFKIVSRGHRHDLYEEFRKNSYIPLREYILDNIDETVMIAQDGLDYLEKSYPEHGKNKYLSRLGTLDFGAGPVMRKENRLRLISCSTLTDIKRVHLIVEALGEIRDINIIWDHYGEGPTEDFVKHLAKEKLGKNIEYKFHGYIDNPALMRIYQQRSYDAFVNVSSSEGVPVSIMEVLSFGIPTIATDVGGTKEIVMDGYNGYLLDADFKTSDLASKFREIYEMKTSDKDDYMCMRSNARESWSRLSSAERNYNDFLSHISNL